MWVYKFKYEPMTYGNFVFLLDANVFKWNLTTEYLYNIEENENALNAHAIELNYAKNLSDLLDDHLAKGALDITALFRFKFDNLFNQNTLAVLLTKENVVEFINVETIFKDSYEITISKYSCDVSKEVEIFLKASQIDRNTMSNWYDPVFLAFSDRLSILFSTDDLINSKVLTENPHALQAVGEFFHCEHSHEQAAVHGMMTEQMMTGCVKVINSNIVNKIRSRKIHGMEQYHPQIKNCWDYIGFQISSGVGKSYSGKKDLEDSANAVFESFGEVPTMIFGALLGVNVFDLEEENMDTIFANMKKDLLPKVLKSLEQQAQDEWVEKINSKQMRFS